MLYKVNADDFRRATVHPRHLQSQVAGKTMASADRKSQAAVKYSP
jgi:hypothetical protein